MRSTQSFHVTSIFTLSLSDWIEDSILERSRRLREARDVYASSRTPNTLWRLISQVRKVVVASQSWLVVSIVGRFLSFSACVSTDGAVVILSPLQVLVSESTQRSSL